MNNATRREGATLWAITSYFNPTGYRRRLANYRLFRKNLSVPLITVELAYRKQFDLTEGDAEILIQLQGNDIMWQKERLLNGALRALPSHCRNIVWVDCDVIFASEDWPARLEDALQRFKILQPFSHIYSVPRDSLPGTSEPSAAECHESVSFAIAAGVPAVTCLGEIISSEGIYTYARGFTWAARRALMDQHGFYDACIIGNGDRAMAGAVYGCYDAVMSFQCMNDRQRTRYLQWAEPFHETVGDGAGWMQGKIHHLWHGEMRDRQYCERHKILPRFDFDPYEDIAIDPSGCWRWSTDKAQMHACVRDYFASRNEDGH
jgi:hypothetical protein